MGIYEIDENRYQAIFKRLNEDQRQVVLHEDGPALTLSSAGSGKTATVVARILHLIHKRDYKPDSILAITFTKKAAEEMKERLAAAIDDDSSPILDKVKIQTIHSFSMGLYNRTMMSMDPAFSKPEIVSSKMGQLFPAFIKLATKSETQLISPQLDFFLQTVSLLKRRGHTIEKYAEHNKLLQNGQIKLNIFNKKGKICYDHHSSVFVFYNFYEKWKLDNNCIDFDDMLLYGYDCLIDPRKRNYAEPFIQRLDEILVDESQDTSTISFKIVDELKKATPNITLVGDTRQCIYAFSGASPENITNFKKTYEPKVFDLKINYRSTVNIVDNANSLISTSKEVIGAPAIAHYKETNEPITVIVTGSQSMESLRIAEDIRYMVQEKGIEPRNIAVLYRVHSQAVLLEDSLYSLKVPYYSYSKQAFYERKEILDIFAYLRVLSNPLKVTKNEFKRIVNKPNNFIPAKIVDEIFEIKREERCSVLQAMQLVSGAESWTYNSLLKFHSKLSAGIAFAARAKSVDQVIDYVLKQIGYLDYMKEILEIRDVELDLDGNFDAIKATASRYADVESFMEHIQELKDSSDKDENGNYVKLMTIHASKGREWEHVFITGICDRMYPFYKAEDKEELEQEKRIMYVGITRPKRQLYLSCIEGKYGPYNVNRSPYINDMKVDYDAARERDLGGETYKRWELDNG